MGAGALSTMTGDVGREDPLPRGPELPTVGGADGGGSTTSPDAPDRPRDRCIVEERSDTEGDTEGGGIMAGRGRCQ